MVWHKPVIGWEATFVTVTVSVAYLRSAVNPSNLQMHLSAVLTAVLLEYTVNDLPTYGCFRLLHDQEQKVSVGLQWLLHYARLP